MKLQFLKSKLHRATVTGADVDYEGSIAIDPQLCDLAHLHKFERVEIYNINNGARFNTYVIHGEKGEICLNGAAARLALAGDQIIICSYCDVDADEVEKHQARVVLLKEDNGIKMWYDDKAI